MNTWVAFLRGINVGGRNLLPMKALRMSLTELGYRNVKTYIQSGNIVLQSPENDPLVLKHAIQRAIENRFSLRPAILLLTTEQLSLAARQCPFNQIDTDPSKLLMYFLAEKPKAYHEDTFYQLRSQNERFEFMGNTFYLYAPDGIARSKLAASVDKIFTEPTTARNARTVVKILALAASIESA